MRIQTGNINREQEHVPSDVCYGSGRQIGPFTGIESFENGSEFFEVVIVTIKKLDLASEQVLVAPKRESQYLL